MGLSLVTGPTQEPVSLQEAKDHLRISVVDDDGLLAGYILAARRHAEGYTRRVFATSTWDYTIDRCWPWKCVDGYMQRRIELPIPPLQSVQQITYVDVNGDSQTLATSDYIVKTDETFGIIEPAYNVTWPDLRYVPSAVTVRFVAGYSEANAVPDEIRTAILLHTEVLYDRNPNDRELLETARDNLLDHYRVLRIL